LVIIGLLIIFFASITKGLTAFGFSLIAVSSLMIILPPKTVVPIVTVLSLLVDLVALLEARKWVDLNKIWPLLVAGVIGTPLGTLALMSIDVGTMKLLVGILIIMFAVPLLIGFKKRIKSERSALAPLGFISGILGGCTSMSGPPVVLFFTNQKTEKNIFRANLFVFFAVLNMATLLSFMFEGLLSTDVANYTMSFLPAMILGTIVGIKLPGKVNESLFRKIALVIVIISGLTSIVSFFI